LSALLFNRPLNVRRREESQASRRLCLIGADDTSGSACRAVACAVQPKWMRTVGDEHSVGKHSVGVIRVMVETNSPSLPTMLAPAVKPA